MKKEKKNFWLKAHFPFENIGKKRRKKLLYFKYFYDIELYFPPDKFQVCKIFNIITEN